MPKSFVAVTAAKYRNYAPTIDVDSWLDKPLDETHLQPKREKQMWKIREGDWVFVIITQVVSELIDRWTTQSKLRVYTGGNLSGLIQFKNEPFEPNWEARPLLPSWLSKPTQTARPLYQAKSIDPLLEQKFRVLTDEWRSKTAHLSVTLKKEMHLAYQRIIGMGEGALPLILKELQERPTGDWFWALKAITGEDPAQPHDDIDGAIQAWLRWGAERGYV